MTIEAAWKAIPNATCTHRGGLATKRPGHADDCARCAAIRALALAVLEEALLAQRHGVLTLGPLRARIEALGKVQEGA